MAVTREEASKMLDGKWYPIENFRLKKGLVDTKLHVIVFDETTGSFIQLFNIGGWEMRLFTKVVDGKMEFTVSCKYDDPKAWFTSYDITECFQKAQEWFEKNR